MSAARVLSLSAQRNEDFSRTFQLWNPRGQEPVDITGWTLRFTLAAAAGLAGSPLVNLSEESSVDVSGLMVVDAESGMFVLTVKKSIHASLPGRQSDNINFVHNLITTDGAGIVRATWRGRYRIEPGVG